MKDKEQVGGHGSRESRRRGVSGARHGAGAVRTSSSFLSVSSSFMFPLLLSLSPLLSSPQVIPSIFLFPRSWVVGFLFPAGVFPWLLLVLVCLSGRVETGAGRRAVNIVCAETGLSAAFCHLQRLSPGSSVSPGKGSVIRCAPLWGRGSRCTQPSSTAGPRSLQS